MSLCEGCGATGAAQQCPKCRELGLPPSLFCTQQCFKSAWATHKVKHTQLPPANISTMSDVDRSTFNFPGPLRPWKITPKRRVPANIAKPDYADHPEGRCPEEERLRGAKPRRYSPEEMTTIREVAKLSREVLDAACAAVAVGVATDEIDRVVHEETIRRGMYPSPLNYYNFPKSVCTSVNEIICHGIPDARPLEEGDIVNIDVSCYRGGYHSDLNETVFVGKPKSDDTVRVVHCAYECLMAAIATVRKDALYRHVGDAIEAQARRYGCSVVRTYTGHGVGRLFHESPTVPHYGNNKAGGAMAIGHVFTIEPMINVGSFRDVTWPDNWTSSTADGKLSAQFEHSMHVTADGVEVLTDWRDSVPFYQRQLREWGIPLPAPERQ